MKKDDIVYIKDDNVLRQEWHLGRVIDVQPSADGLVRKLILKTQDTITGKASVLERPVTKCILLIPADKQE